MKKSQARIYIKNFLKKINKIQLEKSSSFFKKKTLDIFKENNLKIENLKIASFKALNYEPNLQLLEDSLKKNNQIYYPIIHKLLPKLIYFSNENKYNINKFKIIEPCFSKNIIAPWEIDLAFIPALFFNKQNKRLGHGKGFYDKSFSFLKFFKKKPILIGFSFDFNLDFEAQDHDIKVDYAVKYKI